MLKQLRQKKVMKKVLWALALVIIPAFVLWGAGGLREGGRYAGEIFGKKISFEEYTDCYNSVRNIAILTHGSEFQKVREALMLDQAAWDRLVLIKEAQKKGIRVPDEEVIARIASFPIFQTKEGLFNQGNYAMILSNILRTRPRRFEEEMRESLMIERLMARVFKGASEPAPEEIEAALAALVPEQVDETEEALSERRQSMREELVAAKRMEAYQTWREELYARAKLKSYLEPPKEVIETPAAVEGEVPTEVPTEIPTEVPAEEPVTQ
ncbi:MAG: SurA N-terminal domain-containing protein [Candidatus Omnitrophota bacterium]